MDGMARRAIAWLTAGLGTALVAVAGPLAEGVRLTADGAPIDGQIGHLVPAVADWNGDGRKDLLVGQFGGGKIRLYLNEGTDAAPVLKGSHYLSAGGAQISLPAG